MSLLGIDVGTTGCKASVFSEDGAHLSSAYGEYPTLRNSQGEAELDSLQVWGKIKAVVREAASKSGNDRISALSASSLGESVVPLSSDRRILGNSILCSDTRGGKYVEMLKKNPGQEKFYGINPNILSVNYSLPKLQWTRDNNPELFRKTDHFLLWADTVCFLLGSDPVANNSHANRTLLFDVHKQDWSDYLLDLTGIPRGKLGKVVPGGTVIGTVSDRMAGELLLGKGVKIIAGGHDQCCNSLGSGSISAGSAVSGLGSYECITPCFGKIPPYAEMLKTGLNVEDHLISGLHVSFIYNQSGTLVRWFRDTFASSEKCRDSDIYGLLAKEMPDEPTSLLTLPYFEPTGSPHFVSDASGIIAGLKASTTRGEILKSIMESASYYFVDSIESLARLGIRIEEISATGGGAKSDSWLQIKADIFGIPMTRLKITEGSVLGAAMLAGISTGRFSAEEAVGIFVKKDRSFTPDNRRHECYRERIEIYRKLYNANRKILSDLNKLAK
ncbi:MAG: FGGY family carbohydrate kinase [Victivallales bacterium]